MFSMGQGAGYTAVLIVVQKWFPHRIGLASGVIIAGYGLTGFIFSPIETKFINPHNEKVNDDGYFTEENLLKRIPYMFLLIGGVTITMQIIGLTFVGSPRLTKEHGAKEEIPLKFIDVCKTSIVHICFTTLILNSTWYEIMSGLFKVYGEKFISDDFFLSIVDSMCSASNCISRIIWGLIVDKVGRLSKVHGSFMHYRFNSYVDFTFSQTYWE
uniref:Oxalate:formate antiporter n=1 Tax=Acrobeloides nanus TaxID=290746 RepID=A0A914EF74_9BILA